MLSLKKTISIILTMSIFAISSFSKEENFEVDHLAMANMMIYDTRYDVAQEELKLVDKKSASYDAAKFYTLSGVVASKLNNNEDAIINYKKAIEATKTKEFKAPVKQTKEKYLFSIGNSEPKKISSLPKYDVQALRDEKITQLHLYLSEAYYKIKDYKNTVKSLDNAGEKGKNRAALYTLRAECYWKLKDYSNAVQALSTGSAKFPEDTILLKQKFYYFADLKLYQAAIEASKAYMSKVGSASSEYITLAQMLIGANEITQAIVLLEEAKLKFPKEPKIGILLGHMYLKKNMKNTTAQLFEESSNYEKQYLKDAIEMSRRSKRIPHAIYLNSTNHDKVDQTKQNVAMYLERGEFRKVIGMKDALTRYKLLEDENTRYALAYAYYMSGDYDNAETQLKYITDSELFSKATLVRKNIEKCKNDAMECI